MAQLAIDILWLLIGIIILAGVVWLAIWVINSFIYQIPATVEKGIWVIILLLVLIAVIGLIAGGGSLRSPSFWGKRSDIGVSGLAWTTAQAPGYLRRVLT